MVQEIVLRMARRLVAAYSRHKKVFALCDVSGSVANLYCHQADECSTLTQLERVVSRLLRSS